MSEEEQIIDLFDRYHQGRVTAPEKEQVLRLIGSNDNLADVFAFRKSLLSAVRQNRIEDLRHLFTELEKEFPADVSDPEEQKEKTKVFRRAWMRVATAAAAVAVVAGVVFFVVRPKTADPIAIHHPDSTHTVKNDTVSPVSIPERNIAQQTPDRPVQEGVRTLPFYESFDGSLGFGKENRPDDSVIALFRQDARAGYDYGDTLKVYLPKLPRADARWKVVYNKATDVYYLTDDRVTYILSRFTGYHPLKAE